MVRTPHFHCLGSGSVSGQELRSRQAVWFGKKKKNFNYFVTFVSIYLKRHKIVSPFSFLPL